MILCDISSANRFSSLSPAIAEAIDWLRDNLNAPFIKGERQIGHDGRIMVKSEEPPLLPPEKSALEAHRRYIDIHVPVKGEETMGWAPVATLKYPHGDYDETRDVQFFGDSAHSLLHVHVGQIAIFFPEDAHAPNIGIGNHRKFCIKIPVEET